MRYSYRDLKEMYLDDKLSNSKYIELWASCRVSNYDFVITPQKVRVTWAFNTYYLEFLN